MGEKRFDRCKTEELIDCLRLAYYGGGRNWENHALDRTFHVSFPPNSKPIKDAQATVLNTWTSDEEQAIYNRSSSESTKKGLLGSSVSTPPIRTTKEANRRKTRKGDNDIWLLKVLMRSFTLCKAFGREEQNNYGNGTKYRNQSLLLFLPRIHHDIYHWTGAEMS
uniref:Uncharacterized protein n=1 Tax=Steinernema glaseri TaxID=37863 RepID=A0A1I8AJW8_9BILA